MNFQNDNHGVEAHGSTSGNVVSTPKSAVKRTKKTSVVKTPRSVKRLKMENLTPATAIDTLSVGTESPPPATS